MAAKRSKALPKPRSADRSLQNFFDALAEQMEVGQGVRGAPLDRFLTLGDLVRSGLVKAGRSLGFIDGSDLEPQFPDVAPDLSTPPKPSGFAASGGFGYILLTWDNPHEAYSNHAHAKIYRSTENNFANAEVIALDSGMAYTDMVRQEVIDVADPTKGIGYYYWIRFVSDAGVEGPPSDVQYAESIPDLDAMFSILSDQIDESYLAQGFKNRLKGIEETREVTKDLGARWTLTLNVDGLISGIGMHNDGKASDFAVQADRFWIGHQGVKRKPFIVQGGKVFIDTAWIREGTIQEGQIGAISFGKLRDGRTGLPVTTVAGLLKADYIDVDNLTVGSAAVFSGDVRSVNYSATTGFRINARTGQAWFNDVSVRGTIEGSVIRGSVIEGSTFVATQLLQVTDAGQPYFTDYYQSEHQVRDTSVSLNDEGLRNTWMMQTGRFPLYSYNGGPTGHGNSNHFKSRKVSLEIDALIESPGAGLSRGAGECSVDISAVYDSGTVRKLAGVSYSASSGNQSGLSFTPVYENFTTGGDLPVSSTRFTGYRITGSTSFFFEGEDQFSVRMTVKTWRGSNSASGFLEARGKNL